MPQKTKKMSQASQEVDVLTFFQERLREDRDSYTLLAETSLQFLIADQIWYWRKMRGLTQRELAKRAKTKQESIARLESQGKIVSLDFLLRIAKALDVCFVMELSYNNTSRIVALCNNSAKKDIGFILGAIRRERKLSQDELAKIIGTKQPAIARIEQGRSMPSLEMLRKILDALDVEYNISLKPLDVFRYKKLNSSMLDQENIMDRFRLELQADMGRI